MAEIVVLFDPTDPEDQPEAEDLASSIAHWMGERARVQPVDGLRSLMSKGITNPCPGSGEHPKGWPDRVLMGPRYPYRGLCSKCGRDYKVTGKLLIHKHRRH